MAQNKNNINLTEILLQCMGKADPMLEMLKWLCDQLMEAELSDRIGADKHERSDIRSSYRCGYRPRRLDTRMGTMYLLIPKVRRGGYIPFFITERKRSEQIRIDQVRALESFIQVGSHRGRRIILIEPAEAMNEATANALLKSLEEPPPGVHFLLVSHAAERLLPTVRSRTRAIPIQVPEQGTALSQLTANGIPPQEGALWLNRCAGALRYALALAQAAGKSPQATDEAMAEVAILDALLAQLPTGERLDVLALARSCESLIKGAGATTFSDAFTFALLIVVLAVKPTGLFSENLTEKV